MTTIKTSQALPTIGIHPIPTSLCRSIVTREHYLHSYPAATSLSLGVFDASDEIVGAITLGAGPPNGFRVVDGAVIEDCLTLTRFWLSDALLKNSESYVLGMLLRQLKKNTKLKFVLAYSDPAHGHVGTIYQATNWLYLGLSDATPVYDLGDGRLVHSRTLSEALGSRDATYLRSLGVTATTVTTQAKHKYTFFLDQSFRSRLKISVLPYPRRESNGSI